MSMVQVARAARVSQATVSRVMNGQPGVSEGTAQEVLAVARKMGYRPRARSLKRKRAKGIAAGAVAMIVAGQADVQHAELFTRTLFGVGQALGQHGLKLVLVQVSPSGEFVPSLTAGEVAGALVIGRCTEAHITQQLGHVPMVWLTSHSDRAGDHVLAGNEAIGHLAADYLVKKGNTNLVFFNPDPSFAVYRSRWWAFRARAEELGARVCMIESPREGLLSGAAGLGPEELSDSLHFMVDELLEKRLETAGLFIPDDFVTAAVYPVLHEKAAGLGKYLTVISCCNERAYLSGLEPRPATIDLGHEIMGHRAVEQLLWRIRSPELTDDRSLQVTISPVLIE